MEEHPSYVPHARGENYEWWTGGRCSEWCALGSLGRYALCITTGWGLLSQKKALAWTQKKGSGVVAQKKGTAGNDMQCAGVAVDGVMQQAVQQREVGEEK